MKIYFLLLTILVSPMSLAASYNAPGSTVTKLTIGDRYLRVQTTSMVNNEGCEDNSFFRLDVRRTGMLTVILAAEEAQRGLHFQLDECSGKYPEITHIYLD